MHYHVLFDITQTEYPRSQLLAPVIMGFICLGFILVTWYVRRVRGYPLVRVVVPAIVAVLVWSLTFYMTASRYHHYVDIKTALKNSQCEVAEGTVTGFQQIPWAKGTGIGEKFAVNGTQFRYRANSAQSGFHLTGMIRDGMQVRIYYYAVNDPVDKDIARLEIAE